VVCSFEFEIGRKFKKNTKGKKNPKKIKPSFTQPEISQ
jgi:hypothetical protein